MKKKQETPIEKLEDVIEDEAKELKREYKRFERFRDENSLLLGVFTLGLAALVIINTLFWVQWSNHLAKTENKVTTTVASLSASTSLQTAHNFAVQARASNVGENERDDPAFPLGDGETLLTLDLTITNKTAKTQHLLPVNQLYIRSNEGDYAPLKPSIHIQKPLEAQDLAPGKSASGQLSFAVQKRIANPLLYIDTQWDNSTPLVIDVLH